MKKLMTLQPKAMLSWLSGILIVAGAAMQAIPVVFCNAAQCAPESTAGRWLVLLGLVVVTGRNIMKDQNGDGIPDILQQGSIDAPKE